MANLMTSFYTGVSGLHSAQTSLNTTSHNLANAQTKGYVRQQTLLGDKDYNTLSVNISGISNKQSGLGVTYQEDKEYVRQAFLDLTEKGVYSADL